MVDGIMVGAGCYGSLVNYWRRETFSSRNEFLEGKSDKIVCKWWG
jgi:hypothetical protein